MLARGRRRDDDEEGEAEETEARGRVTWSKEEMTGDDARRNICTAGCTEKVWQLKIREQAGKRKRRTRDGMVGAATALFKIHLAHL